MRVMGVLLTGLLALTALLPGMASESDEELLWRVKVGMFRRFTSIGTCKGSVHLVATRPVSEGATQEKPFFERVQTVAFDGNRLRVSSEVISGDALSYQGAFDGEKTAELTDDATGAGPTARITDGLEGFTRGDFAIFVDPRSIGGLPWKNLGPDTGGSVTLVGREALNGDNCVILEITSNPLDETDGAYTRTKVWVDLDKGFTVPKSYLWYVPSGEHAPILMREEVVELKDYGDGIWGPARYTRLVYEPDGTVEKRVTGTYDPEFKINVPISEADLRLTLPPELTSMMDE